MITQQQIEDILKKILSDKDYFLVDIKVSRGNKITVQADHVNGITVEQCAEIHKKINMILDRDFEDYSLVVSSPGLDEPIKVVQQYRKNIGRSLDIRLKDGSSVKGILVTASETEIGIAAEKRSSSEKIIKLEDIETAKVKIEF